MPDTGFTAPYADIIQTAFIVPDITEAATAWSRDAAAGPFFVSRGWRAEGSVYRGSPNQASFSIALGYSGRMQIELIQPEDDQPSVYRELIERSGYGFHHFGLESRDLEADVARLSGDGYELAFRATLPTGSEVVYMDGGEGKPGMVELIELAPPITEMRDLLWQASQGWDGTDPVREIAF